MQKIGFAEALDSIVSTDRRYHRDAYVFLRDALDYTTKQQKKSKGAAVRHVAGPELLEGARLYALKEFGPMALTVFSYGGIERCEDIGQMVTFLAGPAGEWITGAIFVVDGGTWLAGGRP